MRIISSSTLITSFLCVSHPLDQEAVWRKYPSVSRCVLCKEIIIIIIIMVSSPFLLCWQCTAPRSPTSDTLETARDSPASLPWIWVGLDGHVAVSSAQVGSKVSPLHSTVELRIPADHSFVSIPMHTHIHTHTGKQ